MAEVVPPAVGHLAAAERLHDRRTTGESRLFAPLLALVNLFFLAYFERFLTGDRTADSLALLLFLETSLFALLAVTRHLSVTGEILHRASLFPTGHWEAFLFSAISNLRRPVTLLWLGSVLLAFLILSHDSWQGVLVPTLLFSLLVLCTQGVAALLLLRRGSGLAVLWGMLACTTGILVASLLFEERSLIHLLIPVQWVAEAIHASVYGDLHPAIRALVLLACIAAGTLLLARRRRH